jgi:hypothetical protein
MVTQTYGDANHKHTLTSISAGSTFNYDANGNKTTRTVGGETFNLTYDAENHLTGVSGAATASMVYGGDDRRPLHRLRGELLRMDRQHRFDDQVRLCRKHPGGYEGGQQRQVFALRPSGLDHHHHRQG